MSKLGAIALSFLAIGATAGSVLADAQPRAGSVRAGRAFAGHNCDTCHLVASDQEIRPLVGGYAPSFSDIANRPGTTPEALRAFLGHQHAYSDMPYPDLAPADLADVVAYIMSLRQRHAGAETR